MQLIYLYIRGECVFLTNRCRVQRYVANKGRVINCTLPPLFIAAKIYFVSSTFDIHDLLRSLHDSYAILALSEQISQDLCFETARRTVPLSGLRYSDPVACRDWCRFPLGVRQTTGYQP